MIDGIEIFSGAGGLATGIGLSGIRHNAFVEWDHDACNTLRKNHETSIVHEGDIRTFDFSPYSGIDIIAGGPPCQPFSLGGKAKGEEDIRDMFPSAIRSIRELLPKVFFFENVKGLLRRSFHDYFHHILNHLRHPTLPNIEDCRRGGYGDQHDIRGAIPPDESYDVYVNLVNAADYGVPQKRERVIIIGIRKDLDRKWELPGATHSKAALMWDKYVTESYWQRHGIPPSDEEYRNFPRYKRTLMDTYGIFPPEQKPWMTIRDALVDIPKPGDASYFPNEHIIREGAREYPGHTGSPMDEPSKTIKAGGHGVPGGENMLRLSNDEFRYLTVFEAKRIQTFPDSYEITGSWSEAMRQLGNAVPVRLANVISDSIVKTVFK